MEPELTADVTLVVHVCSVTERLLLHRERVELEAVARLPIWLVRAVLALPPFAEREHLLLGTGALRRLSLAAFAFFSLDHIDFELLRLVEIILVHLW